MAKADTTQEQELNGQDELQEQELNESKTVKIKLFKDNGEYKDDVFVCVNGRSYQIQRGIEVEVPDYVAEVLETSANQDAHTADLIRNEVEKYANKK